MCAQEEWGPCGGQQGGAERQRKAADGSPRVVRQRCSRRRSTGKCTPWAAARCPSSTRSSCSTPWTSPGSATRPCRPPTTPPAAWAPPSRRPAARRPYCSLRPPPPALPPVLPHQPLPSHTSPGHTLPPGPHETPPGPLWECQAAGSIPAASPSSAPPASLPNSASSGAPVTAYGSWTVNETVSAHPAVPLPLLAEYGVAVTVWLPAVGVQGW
jgi:hypothetical protein